MSDGGVSFTPVAVLMIIDHTASMNVTVTRASNPTPNQITTRGTNAISGVAWKKFTYGSSTRSTTGFRPMTTPTAIPTTIARM